MPDPDPGAPLCESAFASAAAAATESGPLCMMLFQLSSSAEVEDSLSPYWLTR